MMKTLKLLPLVAALLLAGCATALPELPAQPAPPVQFKEAARWTTAAPAEAQDRGHWWTAFAVVGVVFLVIELVALVISWRLTRSITTTVDKLNIATERVKLSRPLLPVQ